MAIGVGATGQAVELDLKEAARGGMGPHGLVVGATGSGKSELLRTLVLGLAMTHSPESLNFVLVDFKGGATFTRLDALPHTSAVITNLSDELTMVDRMRDAISGEMHRRMELLRGAGHFASLAGLRDRQDHNGISSTRAAVPEIPTLLIVVDEFSELLSAKPDFLDLFVTIGRVGRSLGVHLLLASQRLEEGRLRGLDTYLSYRIGLKTFSGAESRIVLGVPDAFELPTAPGNGYLKFDTGSLLRFKAAYVSGPVPAKHHPGTTESGWTPSLSGSTLPTGPPHPHLRRRRWTPRQGRVRPAGAAGDPGRVPAPTLLDIAVSRLAGSGTPAHEVWIPPLLEPPSLDLLLAETEPSRIGLAEGEPLGHVGYRQDRRDRLRPSTTFGSHFRQCHRRRPVVRIPHLSVPIGWVDRPFEQRRGVLILDLSGSGGHVAIVGAPQTGKSTAVRSLISALALTETPDRVQVYCLDFGGGSLTALSGLPHVGVVAGRAQPDLVRRTVGMVDRIMSRREEFFAANNIGSLHEWRERAESGQVPGDGFGDVFLVVDGWGGVRDSFESLEAQIISMAARGLNFGVHVVLSATRWSEIRPALKDLVSSRVELRLGDPLDSDVNSKAATGVPTDRPGRGLTRDQQHLLTAVPRIDGTTNADGLASATATLVATVADRWPDRAAPEVRLLPSVLRVADLPALETERGYALGLDEDFEPVYWNPRADQHLLIFGEEESGKTTLLANLLRRISARTGTDQARFVIFDGQRQLLDLGYRPDQVIASATTAQDAANVVTANLDRLHRRMPAASASAGEIARRAWWGSPADIFLVVDDYERFAGSNPLVPLLPLLDHAGDIGLHLIIARQARGASRAMYDGVYTRLRDTGSPAVVLSGPGAGGRDLRQDQVSAAATGTGRLGAPPRPGSNHPGNGGLRNHRWNLTNTPDDRPARRRSIPGESAHRATSFPPPSMALQKDQARVLPLRPRRSPGPPTPAQAGATPVREPLVRVSSPPPAARPSQQSGLGPVDLSRPSGPARAPQGQDTSVGVNGPRVRRHSGMSTAKAPIGHQPRRTRGPDAAWSGSACARRCLASTSHFPTCARSPKRSKRSWTCAHRRCRTMPLRMVAGACVRPRDAPRTANRRSLPLGCWTAPPCSWWASTRAPKPGHSTTSPMRWRKPSSRTVLSGRPAPARPWHGAQRDCSPPWRVCRCCFRVRHGSRSHSC